MDTKENNGSTWRSNTGKQRKGVKGPSYNLISFRVSDEEFERIKLLKMTDEDSVNIAARRLLLSVIKESSNA